MADRRAPLDLSRPNVGPGPSPVSPSALAKSTGFVVIFHQRDHFCTNPRDQVRDVAARIDAFLDRGGRAVSIVPEPVERAREWQDSDALPFRLLADPEAAAGTALEAPLRFGFPEDWSDCLGRLPQVSIVDGREEPPAIA
jgi:peroxiredoxin Q/BCP